MFFDKFTTLTISVIIIFKYNLPVISRYSHLKLFCKKYWSSLQNSLWKYVRSILKHMWFWILRHIWLFKQNIKFYSLFCHLPFKWYIAWHKLCFMITKPYGSHFNFLGLIQIDKDWKKHNILVKLTISNKRKCGTFLKKWHIFSQFF